MKLRDNNRLLVAWGKAGGGGWQKWLKLVKGTTFQLYDKQILGLSW